MTGASTAPKQTRVPKRDLLGPDVGHRIKTVRTQRGMSLAQVGGDDLSRSFLSLVESGRSRISLRALAIVAERLQTPISHFLQDEDAQRAAELALDFAEVELERDRPAATIQTIEGNTAFDLDPRAQWLLGRALMARGDTGAAVTTFRRAAGLARSAGDDHFTAEVLFSLGGSLYASDSYDEALTYLREGLDLVLRGPENPSLQARLYIVLGHVHYVRNEFEQAISQYDRALELFGSVYDLTKMGAVFSAMSLASRKQGDLDAALRYSKQSVAAFRLIRDQKLLAAELNNMAMRHAERGELDDAIDRAQESVQRAHDIGAADTEAYARGTLALVLFRQGRTDDAEREASAAEALATTDTPLALVDAQLVRANIAALRNDPQRVDELFHQAIETLRALGHQTRLADTTLQYSFLLRERGDIEGALDAALEAATARARQG